MIQPVLLQYKFIPIPCGLSVHTQPEKQTTRRDKDEVEIERKKNNNVNVQVVLPTISWDTKLSKVFAIVVRLEAENRNGGFDFTVSYCEKERSGTSKRQHSRKAPDPTKRERYPEALGIGFM